MNLGLFCIYDRKAEVYLPPIGYHNEGTAKRELRILAEKNQLSPMVQFPEDFDLMSIGMFNDHDGTIKVFPPRRVCCMTELVKRAVDLESATAETIQGLRDTFTDGSRGSGNGEPVAVRPSPS